MEINNIELRERAESAEILGDYKEALSIWQQLANEYDDPVFFSRVGMAAAKLKLWTVSEKAYKKALDIAPHFYIVMEQLGKLFQSREDGCREDNFNTSKQWLLKALQCKRSPESLTLLGCIYFDMDEFEEAKAYFREAIELDHNYEEAYYNLALLLRETNISEAIELLHQAVKLDPKYFIAHLHLGILLQQQKDLASAEYHYRRCIEINPDDLICNLHFANYLSNIGNSEEADKHWKIALRLKPNDEKLMGFYADFLEAIGRIQEANQIRIRIMGDK
jgi:tetratricopeptide (TPR) repeat protein